MKQKGNIKTPQIKALNILKVKTPLFSNRWFISGFLFFVAMTALFINKKPALFMTQVLTSGISLAIISVILLASFFYLLVKDVKADVAFKSIIAGIIFIAVTKIVSGYYFYWTPHGEFSLISLKLEK